MFHPKAMEKERTAVLVTAGGTSVVLRQAERGGVSAALNRGLAIARGRYLARMDSDDTSRPERLERQVAAMALEDGEAVESRHHDVE